MSGTIIIVSAFLAFLYTGALRIAELSKSRRNQDKLSTKGFTRRDSKFDYLVMVSMHSLFFVSIIAELLWISKFPVSILTYLAGSIFICSQVLRYAAIGALGEHWNTNVMAADQNKQFVQTGPYAWIRHPNYLALILEFLSLPLMFGAWRTAIIFSLMNALVLIRRIRLEESLLISIPGYQEAMGKKSRLIPGIL